MAIVAGVVWAAPVAVQGQARASVSLSVQTQVVAGVVSI